MWFWKCCRTAGPNVTSSLGASWRQKIRSCLPRTCSPRCSDDLNTVIRSNIFISSSLMHWTISPTEPRKTVYEKNQSVTHPAHMHASNDNVLGYFCLWWWLIKGKVNIHLYGTAFVLWLQTRVAAGQACTHRLWTALPYSCTEPLPCKYMDYRVQSCPCCSESVIKNWLPVTSACMLVIIPSILTCIPDIS